MLLRRGIEEATARVVEALGDSARPVVGRDDLRHIATIAAKEDERIGDAIAEALDRVGEEGVVTIEESALPGIEVDFVEGLRVENGFISPYMAADQQRMETVYENPYILMTTKPISHPNELMPVLGAITRSPRPLVILAEKVDGAALGMLIHNSSHGTLEAVAVRAPGFGHRRLAHLQDLAVFTGGHVITDETGLALENVELVLARQRPPRRDRQRRLDDVHRGRRHAPRRSTRGSGRSAARSSARRTSATSRSRRSGSRRCRASSR